MAVVGKVSTLRISKYRTESEGFGTNINSVLYVYLSLKVGGGAVE